MKDNDVLDVAQQVKPIERYLITDEQINEILSVATEKAAAEAIKAYSSLVEKESKKRAKEDDKAQKTKNILKSYKRIKRSIENGQQFTQEEKAEMRWNFIRDLMDASVAAEKVDRIVRDEEKKRQENLYCIHRIEKASELYKEECSLSRDEEAQRRYRIYEMMYLMEEDYSIEDIASLESVSEKTVYRDLAKSLKALEIYLFGY